MRNLDEIIVHTTATRKDWMAADSVEAKVAEIRRWHVEDRGWRDIGYHYVIDRDGRVAAGRPLTQVGAHARGRNKSSVGIALVGGHGGSENDSFEDHYTPAQDASLRALIGQIKSQYGDMKVTGHNQFAAKACPCFHAPSWFNGGSVKRVADLPPEARQVLEDADKSAPRSSSIWVTIIGAAGAGWQAWQSAERHEQILLVVVVLFFAYLLRERIRKANLGRIAKEAVGL